MDKKSLAAQVEIKDETKGEVEAVFATLNVKDKDDDVTIPGAFENGAEVIISAYNHKTWEGALPVGKGTIHEVGDRVVMKGQFFMDTTQGRDHFNTVRALGAKQEWSYGFNVDDSESGEFEGKSVRVLKKMTVYEVSPVMRGAGVGTTTTYAKSLKDEVADAVDAVKAAVESAERVVALRAEKGKSLSNVNLSSLVGLEESMTRLKSLLSTDVSEQVSESVEEVTESNSDELESIWLSSLAESLETE